STGVGVGAHLINGDLQTQDKITAVVNDDGFDGFDGVIGVVHPSATPTTTTTTTTTTVPMVKSPLLSSQYVEVSPLPSVQSVNVETNVVETPLGDVILIQPQQQSPRLQQPQQQLLQQQHQNHHH
ncbi:MAG: hypothetical protein O7C59_06500, partial [Rickettsia endosymbiont of Ixodes persulcatus]|nr:hypothetical protein [Rickettsia endosymbiont of Ixodes persulcatus]